EPAIACQILPDDRERRTAALLSPGRADRYRGGEGRQLRGAHRLPAPAGSRVRSSLPRSAPGGDGCSDRAATGGRGGVHRRAARGGDGRGSTGERPGVGGARRPGNGNEGI